MPPVKQLVTQHPGRRRHNTTATAFSKKFSMECEKSQPGHSDHKRRDYGGRCRRWGLGLVLRSLTPSAGFPVCRAAEEDRELNTHDPTSISQSLGLAGVCQHVRFTAYWDGARLLVHAGRALYLPTVLPPSSCSF